MKKEDLLTDEFLKQFKTGEDLNGFLAQLQKRGLEAIPPLPRESFRVVTVTTIITI